MRTQLALLPKLSDVFVAPVRGTHAKSHRPLDSRKPIHICMRSRFATGKRTLRGANLLRVRRLVDLTSKRYGVKILKYANVGNHLHFIIRLPGAAMTARRQYTKWVRLLTSRIAFQIGGSKKGEPFLDEKGRRAKFWDAIPFSRVIHGRQGWRTMDRYVLKNQLETQGFTSDIAAYVARELYEFSRLEEMAAWNDTA